MAALPIYEHARAATLILAFKSRLDMSHLGFSNAVSTARAFSY